MVFKGHSLRIFKRKKQNEKEIYQTRFGIDLAHRFEKVAKNVLKAGKNIPEINPNKERIFTPGMDTIKNMVAEMEA